MQSFRSIDLGDGTSLTQMYAEKQTPAAKGSLDGLPLGFALVSHYPLTSTVGILNPVELCRICNGAPMEVTFHPNNKEGRGSSIDSVLLLLDLPSIWCAWWDSNPHTFPHGNLNPACLPFHHRRPKVTFSATSPYARGKCACDPPASGRWDSFRDPSFSRMPRARPSGRTSDSAALR